LGSIKAYNAGVRLMDAHVSGIAEADPAGAGLHCEYEAVLFGKRRNYFSTFILTISILVSLTPMISNS